MDEQALTEEALLQLLAFSEAEACVDEASIDEAELMAFARGALAAEHCPRVQDHLDACAYCRALVEVYAPAPAVAAVEVPAHVVARARPSSRPWGIVLPLAAGVAVFAVAILEPTPPSIPYETFDVRGRVEAKMGAATTPTGEHWRVAPGSTLRFVLRPANADAAGERAVLGVFVQTPQGTYRRAAAEIEAERDAGVVAFRIRVTGHELMLGSGGRDRVAFVVAESPEALDDLEGRVVLRGAPGVLDVVPQAIDVVR